jgi:hypothetical protein
MVFDKQREKGEYPRRSRGVFSPQEKRPGRHAQKALLFFLCALIRSVCGSAHSFPRVTTHSCLTVSRGLAPVADDKHGHDILCSGAEVSRPYPGHLRAASNHAT